MSDEITGYHGTNIPNYQKIKELKRFKKSFGNYHYLGNGIYFFIDDFAENGKINAIDWAKTKFNKEQCLLQVNISFDTSKTLDLTTKEGLYIYHKYTNYFLKKIKKKITNNLQNISGSIINTICDAEEKKKNEVYFVKAWTSTFFNKLKEKNIYSAIPNGCELCVRKPTEIIIKSLKAEEIKI